MSGVGRGSRSRAASSASAPRSDDPIEVDDDEPPADVKNVHWTVGGPYFSEFKNSDFADEWFAERERMTHVLQRDKAS